MKKILKDFAFIIIIASAFSACHKLDIPITTEVTPDVFPQNATGYLQVELTPYVALTGNLTTEYFFQQDESTD